MRVNQEKDKFSQHKADRRKIQLQLKSKLAEAGINGDSLVSNLLKFLRADVYSKIVLKVSDV